MNNNATEKKSILMIDDEVELTRSLAEGLSSQYNVQTADSGDQGLAILKQGPIDCVLLDVRMPGKDGIETLEKIGILYPNLPVVMATGHGEEKTAMQALQLGALGYLKKPLDLNDICKEVERSIVVAKKRQVETASSEILLVDDDEPVLNTWFEGLSQQNYNIRVANSAKHALDEIKKKPIDILVTDISMPDMDGFQLIEKASEFQEDFLTIVITGVGSYNGAIEAIQKGALDYLRKPLRIEELKSSVDRGLKQLAYVKRLREKNRLLESQERYIRSIVMSLTDMLIVTDPRGFIKLINPAVGKILSYSEEELIAKPISLILDKSNKILRQNKIGNQIVGEESVYRSKNGTLIPVSLSISNLENSEEKDEYLFLAQDMTEHQRMQETLRQSQKMESVGQLAGGLAHDFNNMLTVIMSSLEFMRPEASSKSLKSIDSALSCSKRAANLTQKLLAFGRKQMMQFTSFDVNEMLSESESIFKSLVGETIELNFNLNREMKNFTCDKNQLEQALINLIINARDAMPKGGMITVKTQDIYLSAEYEHKIEGLKEGSFVLISVTDTGCGMDKNTLKKIFEPFFTTKSVGKGSGLGLSMIYGTVKQLGGHIWVYSEVDHGTTFKICLPRNHEKTDKKEPIQESNLSDFEGNETILLVEDEEALRGVANEILTQHGYQVLEAPDALKALEINSKLKGKIDLVLTDMIMPKMTGKDFVDIIRTNQSEIKVLFMSGYPREAITNHSILENEINFLPKPFMPIDLLRATRKVLDQG